MHDLEHDPAIACPITYNWHGNQELADRASIKLRIWAQMIRDEWPEMSFTASKAITFHHDYELAIAEAVDVDRTAPTPSKEAGGLSVGMMVRNGDGVHLVMHESVALGIGLIDAWDQAFVALEKLDAARPNWESALAIRELFPACVALLAGCGLHYEPHGEGAYVDIPFTDETTPK